MELDSPVNRKPLALIAGQHAWLVRSIDSILSSDGFRALTMTGDEILARPLPDLRPDLVVIEADPPEPALTDLVVGLRERRAIDRCTPIIAVTAGSLTREQRLNALRAGAWDVFSHPLDAETLKIKAEAYIRAKFEADEARERGLIDPATDLYNVRGILRRIYEEASEAARHQRALACVVASLDAALSPNDSASTVAAQAFRRQGRSSDVLGRLGPNEFVVVAPDTDAEGALRLAQRLTAGAGGDGTNGMPKFRAGFAAVRDVAGEEIEPVDLFVRAVMALRSAQAADPEDRVRAYD